VEIRTLGKDAIQHRVQTPSALHGLSTWKSCVVDSPSPPFSGHCAARITAAVGRDILNVIFSQKKKTRMTVQPSGLIYRKKRASEVLSAALLHKFIGDCKWE
jgi:hypothetical protein